MSVSFYNSIMGDSNDKQLIKRRTELLTQFRDALDCWYNSRFGPEGKEGLRSYINRKTVAVRNAVVEAGTLKRVTISPPPALGGGLVYNNLDPFENIFANAYGRSLIPAAIDSIEQALGVYELMQTEDGRVSLFSKEAIDIESAIERALRPSFTDGPPKSERDVQNAVANILRSLGVDFTRDREAAPVGSKSFRPDFIVTALDLAIEVKLAKATHGPADVQEEITADIAAYRTKWRHLMVVIYDLGAIHDPYNMRQSNLKLFGVSVIVVKQ